MRIRMPMPMPILGKKGLSGYVKKLLNLILLSGILIMLGLPFVFKWYLNAFNYHDSNATYIFLLVFLYLTGFFCLWIVYEMNRIFKTLTRKDPFQMDNVRSLNRMAINAFVIAVAYIVKIILYNSFLTIIITMVFIIAGLFLIILSEVFKQAVSFKEENDLTI